MAKKWSQEIQDAIKEAAAGGARYSDTYRRVTAGTLPGLEDPVDIPVRTFGYIWGRSKRELDRTARRAEDPRIARARRETERTDELLAEGLGDEEIAEQLLIAEGESPTDNRLALYAYCVRNRREQPSRRAVPDHQED
jgi:DNA-binding NarL/FixJ family response regulator